MDFIDNSTSSRMSGQEINDLRFKLYDEIISLFNQKREDIVILCDESDNKISQWVNNEYLMEKSKKNVIGHFIYLINLFLNYQKNLRQLKSHV